jgi:hypothetical protein
VIDAITVEEVLEAAHDMLELSSRDSLLSATV